MSELQKTASIDGWRASRSPNPLRPLPSVPGAAATNIGSSGASAVAIPNRAAATVKPFARRLARSSAAVMTAIRRLPLEWRYSATATPIFSCEKPTSMSMGVGVRSQVSTTGMPAAIRRRRPRGERIMPVRTIPSGRRAIMASSNSSSRAPPYPV